MTAPTDPRPESETCPSCHGTTHHTTSEGVYLVKLARGWATCDEPSRTIATLRARVAEPEAESERLRSKLQRAVDWLRYAANNDSGIAAEIGGALSVIDEPIPISAAASTLGKGEK